MDRKEVLMRIGGIILAISGIVLILISGELVKGVEVELSVKAAEFILRAGFGILLIGLLTIFLFSFRTLPKELVDPLLIGQDTNLGRLLDSLELKGNGIYIPASGRLKEERVYIPAEEKPLPLPNLVAEQVLVVGTTGSSMGVSLLPSGSGLIDKIDHDTGKRFVDDNLADLPESLERLSKGSGLVRSISARTKDDAIDLEITHSRFYEICEEAWRTHPNLHAQVGCPGCSSVLSATTRVSRSPLRIRSVQHAGKKVIYKLERW